MKTLFSGILQRRLEGKMTCTFAEFLYKPTFEKLSKKRCPAKLTHPDAIYRQCREAVYFGDLCFYHNMLSKQEGREVKRA